MRLLHGVVLVLMLVLMLVRGAAAAVAWTSDRRLYLDAAGNVVEEGDPDGAWLLVVEGGTLDMARARELGLVDAPESKQVAAPLATKQVAAPPATKAKKDD